jgi:RNA polymerase sigma-54 factor
MRFETSQHMKLGQHMKLAPRMIQSMEILQMPLLELEERIEQELENNATLEIDEGEAPPETSEGETESESENDTEGEDDGVLNEAVEGDEPPVDIDERSSVNDFGRLDSFEDDEPEAASNQFESPGRFEDAQPANPWREGDRDGKLEAMAATPARAASLVEQLRGQWSLVEVEAALRPLGDLLISFLDDDGYLRTALDVVADRAVVGAKASSVDPGTPVFTKKPTTPELERALKAVQLFLEPSGVAARDARECLLLQLDALEEDAETLGWPKPTLAHARTLIELHLDDLLQNRLPRVAEKTGFSLEAIKEALALMRRLSLAPARRLVSDEVKPIIPDAIVEYDTEQDRYIAYLNDSRLPSLRINQEYARLSRDKAQPTKDRDFLKTNLSNAQWLIDAVNQRRHTLLRVVRAVVEAQRDFFDFGPQALKPLPMTQVAEQLGIHVATVSRAVADKHLATPRGIVPLRRFFSGGLQTKAGEEGGGGGEQLAWDAIKVALKEVIDAEDKAKPLSDEALVDELTKRGIEIARRTVAKYRDQLGIPTARLRKTF